VGLVGIALDDCTTITGYFFSHYFHLSCSGKIKGGSEKISTFSSIIKIGCFFAIESLLIKNGM
jgi:hypothetical protein